MSETAEKEMKIIEGDPVEIVLCGKKMTVKRMPIAKQRQAIGVFEKADTSDQSAATVDIMEKILEVATGVPVTEMEAKSNIAEIASAFTAVWEQNGFDFLVQTMAKVTAKMGGGTSSAGSPRK